MSADIDWMALWVSEAIDHVADDAKFRGWSRERIAHMFGEGQWESTGSEGDIPGVRFRAKLGLPFGMSEYVLDLAPPRCGRCGQERQP